jgi:signal transduction histidine kinase
MSFVDITHPDDVRADVDLADRLFNGEIPSYRLQKRYVRKNGELIWINLTASLLHRPDGEPLHGLAMIEDVTEVKRTHYEALARQKLESLGVLAGGIAHDFNNLLGSIHANAELVLSELTDRSSTFDEIQAIRDAADRAAEIVRLMMAYAGQESGAVESVDVSDLVKEMIQLLKVSIWKSAVLKIDLPPELSAVAANAAQIRQVIMNLITNASEASGKRQVSSPLPHRKCGWMGTRAVKVRWVCAAAITSCWK